MLSTWACKTFLTSKFSYLLFCNPTYKTETGTAYRWGTSNSKPHGPIIMMDQSETVISSQIIFDTVFSAGTHFCWWTNHVEPKPISWAKPAYLDFSSNFTLQGYTLSTTGDALNIHNHPSWDSQHSDGLLSHKLEIHDLSPPACP